MSGCAAWLFGLCLMGAVAGARAAAPDSYDLFDRDDTSATLNRLTVNLPQAHVIAGATDEDWAFFYAVQGIPYAITATQAGPGVDLELWIYPNGPDQAGFVIDHGGFGGSETYSSVSWPVSGYCWVRARAAALRDGETSYTLQAGCDTGANLGLATISSTKMSPARPEGDSFSLPATIDLADGGHADLLYTQTSLSYPAGAFSAEDSPVLLLGGMGDSALELSQPWVARWHERHAANFTLTRLGVSPAAQPALPLTLTIQMRAQAVEATLDDGEESWGDVTMRDIPPGARPDQAHIYRWDGAAGEWKLFDAAPRVTVEANGDWLVQTSVARLELAQFGSDFFAAVAENLNGSPAWALYQ